MALSKVPSSVEPNVKKICAEIVRKFSAITHVWGFSSAPTSDHRNHRCVDYMVFNEKASTNLNRKEQKQLGDAIAEYHRKNAKRLGVNGIIWDRKVMGFPHVDNPPYRGPYGEWRPYFGNDPHYDHVHVEYDGDGKAEDIPVSVTKVSLNAKFVIELTPPTNGNIQSFAQNVSTGEWFVSEAKSRKDGLEDAIFYRFDKNGKYLDCCVFDKGGHPQSFGVSDTNILWLTYNDAKGNDVVTRQYKPRKTFTKADTTQMHVFTDKGSYITFSPTRDYCVIREVNNNSLETYYRRSKVDILKNVDDVLGVPVKIKRNADRIVQGWTVRNDNLYVLTGATNKTTLIEKWSFKTGNLISVADVTKVGPKAGEVVVHREAEGMDSRYFGIKLRFNPKRPYVTMRVYSLGGF